MNTDLTNYRGFFNSCKSVQFVFIRVLLVSGKMT